MTIVASFDIGKKNFAFYVEEFSEEKLKSLKICRKFNIDKTMTTSFSELLKCIFMNGTTLLHKNLDLTINTVKGKYLDVQIFYNMIIELDKYKEIFDKCDVIIIEQQMSFKKAQNTMAIKLGQHCFSYFTMRYPMSVVNISFLMEEKKLSSFQRTIKHKFLEHPKK